MKLVIDLQGAQSLSRPRLIGRCSLALAEAMAKRAGGHEVWVALNGAFHDTIEGLRAAFDTLMPQEQIVVWEAPTPVASIDPANEWRARTGEIVRQSFLASLNPNMLHVSSVFEGLFDGAVTSVGGFVDGSATAVTLFDLFPLIHRDRYLASPVMETWYRRKFASMRRAGLWLVISETSRREAIDWLDLPPDKVVNVSAAADARFRPLCLAEEEVSAVRRRYGIARPFIMCTGAGNHYKNLGRLFGAFGGLPEAVRRLHQLLVVCPAQEGEVESLTSEARRRGIARHEIIVVPSVPDSDLVALYNLCAVFCFSSLHEGFALPALEAMQCGAATIGANRSSIPEVIGRADALFDPRDENDITARLHHVLTNADYRRGLAQHGLQQAGNFSWGESARRAWAAFEARHEENKVRPRQYSSTAFGKKPSLAWVSPLPPVRGIADYNAELLTELARHYDIDAIIAQPAVGDTPVRAKFPVHDVAWFEQNGTRYDRILYQFGDSLPYRHVFGLLERHPGIVVLQDVDSDEAISDLERSAWADCWMQALYRSKGYSALQECARTNILEQVLHKSFINPWVLQRAEGVIVHADYSQRLMQRFNGESLSIDWEVIPFLRRVPQTGDRQKARKALGFGEQDFVVGSFGMTGVRQPSNRLLHAWLDSRLAHDPGCHLVLVGDEQDGDPGANLRRIIDGSPARERIRIIGFAAAEYGQYLCAADVAVQLRMLSHAAASAAVFDCMGHGLATVVDAHGASADLPEGSVIVLPNDFEDVALAGTIEELRADPERRKVLGEHARAFLNERLSLGSIAEQFHATIEHFSVHGREALSKQTVAALVAVDPAHRNEQESLALARALNRNSRNQRVPSRQLLVDISEIVRQDYKTGIGRTTRGILRALLEHPPAGYRVEPVYGVTDKSGYRYARSFTLRFLDCPADLLRDEPVEWRQGDIFLGLHLQHEVSTKAKFFSDIRALGIRIYFVVYDLLPILRPQAFPNGFAADHARWLWALNAYADGVFCISRAVADELTDWLNANGAPRARPLRIGWFHLGSDVENSAPSYGLPEKAGEALVAFAARPSFLMVGTIEPRKGYLQTLAAFERLWRSGHNVNLVIVGKQGWMVETLVETLRGHPESQKRLFWLEAISDEYLERIYAVCDCLIAASEGEGFGLPLIEAARHKIPIIARSIPVFREVAGKHASYFGGEEPDDLADAVKDWLLMFTAGRQPKSDDMPWLTWAESVERLKAVLLQGDWYTAWPLDKRPHPKQNEHTQRAITDATSLKPEPVHLH